MTPAHMPTRPARDMSVTLDVVVPVHNEMIALPVAVRRISAHLATLPWSSRITIADSGSTDRTGHVARELAQTWDVRVVSVDQPGRGRAIREAWRTSGAAVLAYMDVDLSTDLGALAALVSPLLADAADVAIGSRLLPGSVVVRGPKREVISRSYNTLLRRALGARFTDAQCGFKALRSDAARALLDRVEDEEWFFDTELLVLAQRSDLRIHEVAVRWVDDPDSSVALCTTVLADLRGVHRLRRLSPTAGGLRLRSSWSGRRQVRGHTIAR